MKLYFYGFIMLIKKFIFKYDSGKAILWFASKMGVVYIKFAKSVNNKVDNCKNIVVPKLYKKMCTDNIIVMEFINNKTINQIKLNNKNKERIQIALNDYINLSLYALFKNKNVTFHGDPHSGNIYLDKNGNIGFLDMGLVFNFKDEEAEYIINLLLYSYFKKSEELTELLLSSSKYVSVDKEALHEEIKKCCSEFKNIPVTNYFINMVMIFTKYDINPPEVLYKLTKAFVALNGINNFSDNVLKSEQVLTEKITEYYVSRTVNDFKDIIDVSAHILPNFIKESVKNGITKGISKQVNDLFLLNKKINKTTKNFNEVLSLIK